MINPDNHHDVHAVRNAGSAAVPDVGALVAEAKRVVTEQAAARPVLAAAGALAVGFVLGRILRSGEGLAMSTYEAGPSGQAQRASSASGHDTRPSHDSARSTSSNAHEMTASLASVSRDLLDAMAKRPLVTIGTAFAVGFVLGGGLTSKTGRAVAMFGVRQAVKNMWQPVEL